MNVLVTGSGGQDGRLLIPLLVKSGYEVICASKTEIYKVNPEGVTHKETNLGLDNKEFCNYILNKFKPKIIFHLAAVHGSRESGSNFSQVNFQLMQRCHVQITANILDWMKRVKFNPKLIYPLTSQMYLAEEYPTVVDETKLPKPVNQYAKTKLEAWKLIQEQRLITDVNVSCIILFTHTSIYAKNHFLLPSLANKLLTALNTRVFKVNLIDALTPISLCSAEEVVFAMYQLSKLDYPTDVLIGSSNLKTPTQIILEFVHMKSDLGISEIEITSGTHVVQPYLSPITRKAQRILDWNPQINPVDILIDIFENQKRSFTQSWN
jgi:GDPmannose 4,6-dehydratase